METNAAENGGAFGRTRICRAYSRFPSLKKAADIRNVYRKGKRYSAGWLHLFLLYSGNGTVRLCPVISKKNGNSVVRHRFQRLVKEVFRLHADDFKGGADVVVSADKAFRAERPGDLTYRQTEEALLRLMRKAKML